MTHWSFEVPIPHLEDFDDLQDFYFTLSFLYENEDYARFIEERRRRRTKMIWLDNSYNEKMKADDPLTLCNQAAKIRADCIIAPDDPNWSTEDIEHIYNQTKLFIHSGCTVICVVSSLDMYEKIEADLYAVSYWTRDENFTRLEKHLMTPDIHFLGLLSVQEIIEHEPWTCDTSMPIKLALQGKTLHQWVDEGCQHIHTKDLGPYGMDFFHTKMTNAQIDLARANIYKLKKL